MSPARVVWVANQVSEEEHHMTNNSTADAVGVVEAYMQALQIKDTDTILRLYADEAEIIPENRPSLRGRDAVESFYANTFAAIGMEVNVEVVSTEVYDE